MDKHEKGIEIDPTRADLPLPLWKGKYGGDLKRLPRVVQKLLHRRILSPEEKAELLWRFYELDLAARVRQRVLWTAFFVICVAGITGYFALTHWSWLLSRLDMLAPPSTK
ncbi:MAG: hypothetical protein E6K77_03715 [Candidatus Eisenbacteria bacterium]|uniref:Uncharacterized protein n=1 Tax=Eiseniibacteriota bacterium TaxID=2212470 RepID=A0A538TLR0_UNCEI|nr:MAG: hypothetical protein E6K77_03715 [Candidatus Eisenbacteria bacterium]